MARGCVLASVIFVCAFAATGRTAAGEAPKVLTVQADGQGEFSSLQAAIDAAPAGAIIELGPGTFHGPVRIDKPLTLQGAGAERTILTSNWVSFHELVLDGKGVPPESRARYEELRPVVVEKEHGEGPVSLQLWREFGPKPTLTVKGTKGVIVRGLGVTMPGTVRRGGGQTFHMVVLEDAGITVDRCAFVGSAVDGVQIQGKSTTNIENCLVGGIHGSGIVIKISEGSKVEIENCDIRGCGYAGVNIDGDGDVTVANSRIYDIEFHGIRYDDTSPKITRNAIFNITRLGIYIDGDTQGVISHNLFLDCGIGGNGDRVVNNTFVQTNATLPEHRHLTAIHSSGMRDQLIEGNIISGYRHACVYFSTDKQPINQKGKIFKKNLCDTADTAVVTAHSIEPKSAYQSRSQPEYCDLPLPDENWQMPVIFSDPKRGDYSLSSESDWPDAKAGAHGHAPLASPWPEHPAERAMREQMREVDAE